MSTVAQVILFCLVVALLSCCAKRDVNLEQILKKTDILISGDYNHTQNILSNEKVICVGEDYQNFISSLKIHKLVARPNYFGKISGPYFLMNNNKTTGLAAYYRIDTKTIEFEHVITTPDGQIKVDVLNESNFHFPYAYYWPEFLDLIVSYEKDK